MTPWLLLDADQRQLVGRYLRTLIDVEYAYATAHFDDLESALAGVDPADLRELIRVIESAGREPQVPLTREVGSLPNSRGTSAAVGVKKHQTTVSEVGDGVYIWKCSCGDYDRKPMRYRIATAGAKRHRDNIRELNRVLKAVRR